MAPTAIRKLIERNGHKWLIGIGSIQVQAFCNLILPRAQFTLEHKGHPACVTLPYGGSDRCRVFDDAVRARLVASLDFVGIKPIDARMRRSGAHLMRHDHPKRPVLLGRRAHRQAQPHALVAHHQAHPITHASETLGNKSSDIPLERSVTHSRNHNAAALVDCQRRCSGCGQCLNQNLQLGIAVHGSPRLQPRPIWAPTSQVFQN